MGLSRSITDPFAVPLNRQSPQTLSGSALPRVPLYEQIPSIGFDLL
jgi:hypothetical protein